MWLSSCQPVDDTTSNQPGSSRDVRQQGPLAIDCEFVG